MTVATLWVFLPPDHGNALTACLVDKDGAVLKAGPIDTCLGDVFDQVIAVVAGVDVALAKLSVPQGMPAQMQTAAHLMIRDVVVAGTGSVAVAPRADQAGQRWTAQFDTALCDAVLERLAAYDLDPEAIVPAALLLPAAEDGAVRSGYYGLDIAQTSARGFAAEPDVMDMILSGQQPIDVMAPEALQQRLPQRPPLNLRIGARAKRDSAAFAPRWLKRSAIFALIAAFLWPALPLVDVFSYRSAIADLDAQTMRQIKAALPDAARIVNARAQLDERIAALGLSGGGEQIYGALVNATAQSAGIVVEQLSYDARQGLSATLIVGQQSQLDPLTQRLRSEGFFVDAGDIRITRDGPRAELVIKAQP